MDSKKFQEVLSCLIGQDLNKKKRATRLIKRDGLSDSQVKLGLLSENVGVLHAFLDYLRTPGYTVSKNLFDFGLSSKSSTVREFFLYREDVKITKSQVSMLLNDESYSVRRSTLGRKDVYLSSSQINLLVSDTFEEVRSYMASQNKFALSKSQIRILLKDNSASVRQQVARNYKLVLDKYQIERGFRDEAFKVRLDFMLRPDFKWSEKIFNIAVVDDHGYIRGAALEMTEFLLRYETMLKIIRTSEDYPPLAITEIVNRKEFFENDCIIEEALKSPNKFFVVEVLAARTNFEKNKLIKNIGLSENSSVNLKACSL